MDRSETAVILIASLVLGVYGGWGEQVGTALLKSVVSQDAIHHLWPMVDVLVVTFGCLLLIWCYKKLRVGCYPATFIYCFDMPQASNLSAKSQVVGYFHINPDLEDGDITAEGASFFWDNDLDPSSRVGFKSVLVYATQEGGETTCHIRFNIDEQDHQKRLYRHGHLRFQLTKVQRPL